jgi:hypothetical protein
MSRDAVLRDEAISYWEAWMRDTAVQGCMQTEGFDWEPEVLYPEDAVADVAQYLGVPVSSVKGASETAEVRNARVVAALDGEDRDRYFLSLLGETAAVIDYVNENGGQLPTGRDSETFARGGCRGEAEAAVGSVWDLRRAQGQELLELHREARQAPELAADHVRFQVCAAEQGLDNVTSPADVEQAIAEGGKRGQAAGAVQTRCAAVWNALNEEALAHAADAFRTAQAATVEIQTRKYATALDRIRQDESFLRFVAEAAVRQPYKPYDDVGAEQEAKGY